MGDFMNFILSLILIKSLLFNHLAIDCLLLEWMNTAFSLGEDDEKYPNQDDAELYNIDSINYKSPSLPLHFDKKYLPSTLLITQKIFVRMSYLTQVDAFSSITIRWT